MRGVAVLYHFPVTVRVALLCTRQQEVVNDLDVLLLIHVALEDVQDNVALPELAY
jgi:hypothetical protein